jgi:assimilatory nitrate reductase catalytic subunit
METTIGVEEPTTTTATHCPYCAMQCGMNLVPGKATGGAIRLIVAPRPDFPTNKGGMCQKGWNAAELLTHPERLTTPLMRDHKGGELRPVSWNEALDRVATEIGRCQERYGRDSVGIFGGGGLTNEKAYLLGKFARVALRTPHIDYNGRFCMSSAAAAGNKAFGVDRGLPFPLEDIPGAETILLMGSNIAETMPPIMQYFDEQQRRGGKLIVADPRATATAQKATLHLQLTPGTDLALANGLLHIVINDRLIDRDYIAKRTRGFEEVRRVVAGYWPERVERITGVPVEQLREAAHLLGKATTAMVLTARGTEQQSKGVESVLGFINLALALGKVGKPHSGWGCLTGQGNGQGGREHGQKADQLPGYRLIANPQHRAHIAKVWGVEESTLPGPGRSAYELLDTLGMEGGVRALLVMASNIVVSAPRAGHVQERLDALDFLVVADLFLSETAARADVVLPSVQWAEEGGTMTNLEGRVLLRQQASAPPAGAWSDAQILTELATRLGYGQYFMDDPRQIFEELRRASAGGIADYSGITYERIVAEDGVFWPCPSEDHPGTPRLFMDRFYTEDGRARFHAVKHRPAAEEPDDEYPLYLTTGRVMAQYQSGAQTRRVKALNAIAPEPFVEIHPAMATYFDISNGDAVQITTRRGVATATARLTSAIRQDTIFIPFHWGGKGRANLLTNPALDPTSKMPEFKVCAARVEKIA